MSTINKSLAGKYIAATSTFLILLFVYAATSKLLHIKQFIGQIRLSPLIPSGTHETTAFAIPVTELLISLALCFKKTRKLALYASYFLMLLFTLYIYILLNYSTYIPCSCGGILGKMPWDVHIVFNLLVSIMAGIACFLEERTGRPYHRNVKWQNSIS